jgi:hypothetical protein
LSKEESEDNDLSAGEERFAVFLGRIEVERGQSAYRRIHGSPGGSQPKMAAPRDVNFAYCS